MRSKKLIFSLVLLISVSLVVVGCSSQNKKEFLSIATGGTSGTYYPIGGAIAKIINSDVSNVSASAQSTGASVTNTRLMKKEEVELAILQNDIASYAFNGQQQFKDKAVKNMRGIATLYPEVIQIVVREGTGIDSIQDLKDKKVAVGAPGSGVEANAKQILKTFDITYDDIDEDFLSFGEAASRLKDRQIDAAFLTAGVPTAAVMDVASTQDIKLLSFNQEQIDKLHGKYPFLTGLEVPAGVYKGQDEKFKTIALKATLVVQKNLDKKLVYEITKSIFENRDELINAHKRAKDIKVESAKEGMTIPLHSGAKKYFKEVE
ncbi:TAXI family TRAP transporter solute-binding subunit [Halanaerocella petrolearia]